MYNERDHKAPGKFSSSEMLDRPSDSPRSIHARIAEGCERIRPIVVGVKGPRTDGDSVNVPFFLLKLSTPCILVINHFLLFQLHAHNTSVSRDAPCTLNTYIYDQLPPTCFGVRRTIFRENIALLKIYMLFFLQRRWCNKHRNM
jgi:hypothetical protein